MLKVFEGNTVKNLIDLYERENVISKISHAYFSELIDFSDNYNRSELLITGSEVAYYPPHLAIELADKCNLRCKHCYREAGNEGEYIDFEKLKQLVLKLKNYGLKLVEVTGGEPTMHPQFNQIIDFLCSNLPLVAVLTNGVNITEEMLHTFERNKENLMINISIDSSNEEFHDKFRGQKGAWSKTVSSLRRISKIPVLTRVAMSIVPDNMFDIENTIQLAKNNGAKSFAWEVSNTNGRGNSISWNRVSQQKYEMFMKESKYLQIKYHEMITYIPPKYTKKMQQGCDNCGAGWRTFAIDPYGNIRSCVNSNNHMFEIGNVFKDGLEIFSKDILFELAKIGVPRYETCKMCKAFSYCQGCYIKGIDGAINNEECNWEGKSLLKYIDQKNYIASDVEKCISMRSLKR